MKTLKAIYLLIVLVVIVLPFASCVNGGVDIFGTKIEVVNSRNQDGTIKAYKTILNSSGEAPNAHALILHYPSGNLGVSAWFGNEAMANQAPKLKR
jgi:hypothetical protein